MQDTEEIKLEINSGTFWRRLNYLAQGTGISMRQLARKLGMHQNTLYTARKESLGTDILTVARAAAYFDVSPTVFFDPHFETTYTQQIINDDYRALLQCLRGKAGEDLAASLNKIGSAMASQPNMSQDKLVSMVLAICRLDGASVAKLADYIDMLLSISAAREERQ